MQRTIGAPANEFDPIVQERPSMSDTTPPASVTSRLPAPVWTDGTQKTAYAPMRPAATYGDANVLPIDRTSHRSARMAAAVNCAARSLRS